MNITTASYITAARGGSGGTEMIIETRGFVCYTQKTYRFVAWFASEDLAKEFCQSFTSIDIEQNDDSPTLYQKIAYCAASEWKHWCSFWEPVETLFEDDEDCFQRSID